MLFKRNRWIIGLIMLCFMPKMTCLAAQEVSLYSVVEAEETTFSYTGGVQTFTAPKDAVYKLEVWGGQGSAYNWGMNPGGKGGYSVGYIMLTEGTPLYVYVGQVGNGIYGGYNGGGNGGCHGDSGDSGYGGGGCTHIAYKNRGVLSNYASYRDEVLIVAGGGGGQGGYRSFDTYRAGGTGGGTVGGNGYSYGGGIVGENAGSYAEGVGGSQSGAGNGGGFGYGGSAQYGDANHGGGGGGWYGGGKGGVHGGGGGGSGYIGGVPEFTFAGTVYSPTMENGIQGGNGYAKITMLKKLVAASFEENEIEVIEKKQVCLKADVAGAVSHKWQMQKKEEEIPSAEKWEDIDIDTLGMTENVILDEGNGTIELQFTAEKQYSEYWFRLCIYGEEETIESEACLLNIVPLKIDYLEMRGVLPEIEAGMTIHVNDFEIWGIYNNDEIEVSINQESELLNNLYFMEENNMVNEMTLNTVSEQWKIVMHLEHEDSPQDVEFFVSVCDFTQPELDTIEVTGIKYCKENAELPICIQIKATDNSDGKLEYWYERESDEYISDRTYDGTFDIILNGNDLYKIYVEDESGNILCIDQEIVYVDTEIPIVSDITVNPNTNWSSGNAEITIMAEDTLSGLHENAYSFDGGVTWQESNAISLEKSADLVILVRDKVGNISDAYEVAVHKILKKSNPGKNTEPEEILEIISQIPYEEMQEKEAEKRLLDIYSSLPTESKQDDGASEAEEKQPKKIEEEMPKMDEKEINGQKETNELQEVKENKIPLARKRKTAVGLPAAVGTAAVVTATGMFFGFFILFRKADVFFINELLQEEYVVSRPIRKRKNGFSIKLRKKDICGIGNKRFSIKISKRFARRNDGRYLDIILENKIVYTLCIKEKMYFYLIEKD